MKLFAPLDSEGHICGFDPGYEEYPYMYIWDIEEAVTDLLTVFDSAVCVKACPVRVDTANASEVFMIDCVKTQFLGENACNHAPLKYNSHSCKCFMGDNLL